MSYVVLARKWRPMTFDDLVGQAHISQTLRNAIATNRVAHAFLFTGVRGVGKTTCARILAKALNCLGDPATTTPGHDPGPTASPCLRCAACQEITEGFDVDVREIDGASYNGVDEVRKLQDTLPYSPSRDRYKIFIVDEVHMLSQSAWNAFLKTLEEPPPHVKFIFATTEVHKVPVTILSRVQRFDFKLLTAQQIADRLAFVLEREHIASDDSALATLARQAEGSMRDAMSLLDQVLAYDSTKLVGSEVARLLGVASQSAIYDLAECVLTSQIDRMLQSIHDLVNQGVDLTIVARDLLHALRDLVVIKSCKQPNAALEHGGVERTRVVEVAALASLDDLLRVHQGFSQHFDDIARTSAPRSALEMLLVRLACRPPLVPVDDLIARLENLERRLVGQPSAPRGPSGATPPGKPAPAAKRVEPDAPSRWRALVEGVRAIQPELAAYLGHAHPRRVDEQAIVLGFEPGSVFSAKVERPESIAVLKAVCRAELGVVPAISIETLSSSPPSASPTVAEARRRERAAEEQAAIAQAREHPLVVQASRVLGGRIKTIRLPDSAR